MNQNLACPFTAATFDLLAARAASSASTYLKADFTRELEKPSKALLQQVADQLPKAITDRMETKRGIFPRISKKNLQKTNASHKDSQTTNASYDEGVEPFYWGAFYPRGEEKTEAAQLFLWINSAHLEFGFFLRADGKDQRKKFLENCETCYQSLLELLKGSLSDPNLFFVCRSHADGIDDSTISSQSSLNWQDGLKNPRQLSDLRVAIVLSKATVLTKSTSNLASQILQTYKQLFPLVLLAISEDPISEIEEYLKQNGLLPPANSIEPIPKIEKGLEKEKPAAHPIYSLVECAAATYLDEEQLKDWVQAIHRKGQAILYGPPGTGKTFLARELAKHLVGGRDGAIDIVQFHPAYTYEDFIQGIRPKRVEGGLDYPIVPGRFLEFCKRSQSCGDDACVLIIDEINRANLSQVFGELMYLLEYRDQEVYLASGETFRIPTNVRLIGTMNTADRSIALVDHALRRRFAFLRVEPNYEGLEQYHASTSYSAVSKLVDLLKKINQQIGDPHYEIGTSFFLREKLALEIQSIWQLEIEPYLEEFFFDQPAKMNSLKWETVQKALAP